MHNFETVLALLVGVTFLALVARRLDVPTPALLVAGGVLVAVLPGLPVVQFDPQLVFLVFIPPLLYRASLLASYRDVRANLRPILLLGVGHVLFVTIVVAWVARLAVPGLPWASACALGAVVSPPDVAAATAFLRRLPLPRRLVIILEGESMINDAAAIVAYRMAVAAAVTGAFSLTAASLRFLYVGAGGVVIGLAVIVARCVGVVPSPSLPRLLSARVRQRDPSPPWQLPVLVSWAGLRGADSLVLAAAIPTLTATGAPFPGRDFIIAITFAVILVTLLGQGFTLAPLLRWLGVRETGEQDEREEIAARLRTAEAALARLEDLSRESWMHPDALTHTRDRYRYRARHLRGHADGVMDGPLEAKSEAHLRLARELLAAERRELLRLRDEGTIGDAVMRRVQRELDYEELLLHHE